MRPLADEPALRRSRDDLGRARPRRLVVKIAHAKKDQGDEYQPFTATELLDVRVGADPDLFEKPKGYTEVKTYPELLK